MDINKGRFCPNVNALSLFSQNGARSPFDGEICVDDDTHDIGYWVTDDTGAWVFKCRTKDYQKYLENYEEDTTFSASKAFNSNEQIRRVFYNKETLKCWLDDNNDVSKYSYYAIKSIRKINGEQRYITGVNPHDGLNYENALIPVGETATLVFEILPSIWYSVEFYNEQKAYKATINYISYPSKIMPIEKDLRVSGKENDVRNSHKVLTDIYAKFNQSLGKNKAYLYLNQDVSVLKCDIVKKMSGGFICNAVGGKINNHVVITNNTSTEIKLKDLLEGYTPTRDDLDLLYLSLDGESELTTEISDSTIIAVGKSVEIIEVYLSEVEKNTRINLLGFDKIDNTAKGIYNCNVTYSYIKTNNDTKSFKIEISDLMVLDNNDATIPLSKSNNDRVIKSVQVSQIGYKSFVSIEDYSITSDGDNDYFVIPRSELGLGRNIIKIIYTEENDSPLVRVSDLNLSIPVTVEVIEDNSPKIVNLIPAGYIENPSRGLYYIRLKYFALFDNGSIYDVSDMVDPIQEVNASGFGSTQSCSVEIATDKLRLNKTTYTFTVYCEDPAIAGNNSRVIINGNSRPRCLIYDGFNFKFGIYSGNNYTLTTFEELLSDSALRVFGEPTHVRVVEVLNPSLMYTDIVDDVSKLVYVDYIKYKERVVVNSDSTVEAIIDTLTHDSVNNYVFYGYSLDGENLITEEENQQLVKAGEYIDIYKLYIKNQTIYSASKDKPFLVEGFRLDETGKYISTGAVVHYAVSA